MARTVVTPELIEKMNILYLQHKTYAAVSRELGGSPSPTTVKKYIIPNFQLPNISAPRHKKVETLPDFATLEKFTAGAAEVSLTLTEKEREDVRILWSEISI